MHKRVQGVAGAGKSLPQFWTQTLDGVGATVLSYAIRGGMAQFAVAALGLACFAAGASGAFWLLTEGEITIGGLIFVVVVGRWPTGLRRHGLGRRGALVGLLGRRMGRDTAQARLWRCLPGGRRKGASVVGRLVIIRKLDS